MSDYGGDDYDGGVGDMYVDASRLPFLFDQAHYLGRRQKTFERSLIFTGRIMLSISMRRRNPI